MITGQASSTNTSRQTKWTYPYKNTYIYTNTKRKMLGTHYVLVIDYVSMWSPTFMQSFKEFLRYSIGP